MTTETRVILVCNQCGKTFSVPRHFGEMLARFSGICEKTKNPAWFLITEAEVTKK